MTQTGPNWSSEIEVPDLIGLTVPIARDLGHNAGFVVTASDPDGPPLGVLTWPGIWIVTAQHPTPGSLLPRSESLVIDFEKLPGDEKAGVREPRRPLPDPGVLSVEHGPVEGAG